MARKSYTEEFKANLIARASEIGMVKAAKEAGISYQTLSKWIKGTGASIKKNDIPGGASEKIDAVKTEIESLTKTMNEKKKELKSLKKKLEREKEEEERRKAIEERRALERKAAEERKELEEAMKNSGKSYEEIMAFLSK